MLISFDPIVYISIGNKKNAELIIKAGATVDIGNKDDYTPLFKALLGMLKGQT